GPEGEQGRIGDIRHHLIRPNRERPVFEFLHSPEFVLKRSRNEPHLFGNVGLATPSWEAVFESLNRNLDENRLVKTLANGGFVTHDAESLPGCADLMAAIQKVDDPLPVVVPRRKYASATAHCYISVLKYS